MEVFDPVQHVTLPTHKYWNTLDLVITHRVTTLRDCVVSNLLSDHNSIRFNINVKKSKNPRKKITFHQTQDIDISAFKKGY